MPHHLGDHYIICGGRQQRLRLTMGALAAIASALGAAGPRALSQRLRALSRGDAGVLLGCLIDCEASSPPSGGSPAECLSDDEITAALPKICALFEEAFHAVR